VKDFDNFRRLTDDLQKLHPRPVRPSETGRRAVDEPGTVSHALEQLKQIPETSPIDQRPAKPEPEPPPSVIQPETPRTETTAQVIAGPAPVGNKSKRSRKRTVHTKPQQIRARNILKVLYPERYPTRDEVPDADLWITFCDKYEELKKTTRLSKSKFGRPAQSSVMREVGRKD
jgi:hypothetical protein